jgi:hypothetical protein
MQYLKTKHTHIFLVTVTTLTREEPSTRNQKRVPLFTPYAKIDFFKYLLYIETSTTVTFNLGYAYLSRLSEGFLGGSRKYFKGVQNSKRKYYFFVKRGI